MQPQSRYNISIVNHTFAFVDDHSFAIGDIAC
jgi:hypothetical protein